MMLLSRFRAAPDVSRAGEHAISLVVEGHVGEPLRLMMSRRQAVDLAEAIKAALKREVRT